MPANLIEQDKSLAINGGKPVVVDKPASYLHGPLEIGEEEIAAVTASLRTQNLFRYLKDPKDSPVAEFERQFSQLTRVKHTLAVNSGTSALVAALVGLGVSAGDEVIVPAYTYIATASAVLAVRAIPVIAEIDNSITIDPADIEKKITARTRAIVPVHMRGIPCRMDEIMAIGNRHKIPVLEDVAQANGGFYKGRPLGSIGQVGIFSFQHFKVITSGEGGAVCTSDQQIFERAACYHDSAYQFWLKQGWSIEPFFGENYRLSEMNGALALAQLQKRDRILTRLRQIKKRMWDAIADLQGIEFQDVPDRAGDCGLCLMLLTESADQAKNLANALTAEGMAAGSMFDRTIPDRHIFANWDYILNKKTPDLHGHPWNDSRQPCQVNYSTEMCPRSMDYLRRLVVFPFTQIMSDRHVDSCIVAIRKVFGRV